ncbi:helix-turn-helix domain-containing protein [Halobacillus sp. A1]|uniref:Helix-turn-helix domain-containing protein n=1 Tax=Halobacillus campisalis TaxID=435909 RepID=A0ABW2K9A6_9BACI|nr:MULTISPECIES: helix-turn-helix domain-containing protein [Halobacillus]MCP3030031.1 helix-turn-helix domain-containing protein [Halobacillus sp. A1]
MFLTVEETAEYLDVPEAYVENLIREQKVRTIHDGAQYLINQNQFASYFDQIQKYRDMIEEYLNEPIPKDPDIKDED